mmetsp:Transcript_24702/g.80799  ORF Transcript_24702/g.80799 Transcript_24702/m.80799 type:complete len:207 (+) Transcript_24702:389-1009(+)
MRRVHQILHPLRAQTVPMIAAFGIRPRERANDVSRRDPSVQWQERKPREQVAQRLQQVRLGRHRPLVHPLKEAPDESLVLLAHELRRVAQHPGLAARELGVEHLHERRSPLRLRLRTRFRRTRRQRLQSLQPLHQLLHSQPLNRIERSREFVRRPPRAPPPLHHGGANVSGERLLQQPSLSRSAAETSTNLRKRRSPRRRALGHAL